MLLLTCQVSSAGRGQWGAPTAEAYLWDGQEWQILKGKPGASLLKARQKRATSKVFNSLDWFRRPKGPAVAKVSQFLQKVGLDCHNVGQRVAIWNRMLKRDGLRFKIAKVRWAAGSDPWCGTKQVFAKVIKHLKLKQ
jgi:hypothetical protein